MAIVRYLISFLLKNLKWFIVIPLCVGLLMWFLTRNMTRRYEANTIIYTGIVSGFSIDQTGSSVKNYFTIENALDNLKTIIKSQTTLEEVCLRLFAQSMIYGDLEKDNLYISANSFRNLWGIVPLDVKALIDKSSIDNTVMRLKAYKSDDPDNFIYGLIYYEHPDYSVKALSNVETIRKGNSDMLELRYSSYDPALAYQTVLLMSDIFRIKYRELQFSETNDVVGYFRAELAKQRAFLRELEDSLMIFKHENKIIEYDQQTREIASMDAELQKSLTESELSGNSSQSALGLLDDKVQRYNSALTENTKLLGSIDQEAVLVELISKRESGLSAEAKKTDPLLLKYKAELEKVRSTLNNTTSTIGKFETSPDGILSPEIMSVYLLENITAVKSDTQKDLLINKRNEMDTLYKTYSIVGANLKRMEREIKVAEHSYLNILDNLNSALQRQKDLQLSSASLQVITPAVFPVRAIPSKRKQMVLAATAGSLIFVFALLLFMDLIPTTLANPEKAARLTGRKVLTSFPWLTEEKMTEPIAKMSIAYLGKLISLRVESGHTLVVNLLSMEPEQGKTFIADQLEQIFKDRGYIVRYISHGRDFNEDSKTYDFATSYRDILGDVGRNYDVVIIEHPAMLNRNIPVKMLDNQSLNLLVCMSTSAWTQSCVETLKRIDAKNDREIDVILNGVAPEIMEGYVGPIPPVTWYRQFRYNLINLDFRSLAIDMVCFRRRNKTNQQSTELEA